MVEPYQGISEKLAAYGREIRPLVEKRAIGVKDPGILISFVSWSNGRPVRLLNYIASRLPEFGKQYGIDPLEAPAEPLRRIDELNDDEIIGLICCRQQFGWGEERDYGNGYTSKRLREMIQKGEDAGIDLVALEAGALLRLQLGLESGKVRFSFDPEEIRASQSPTSVIPRFIL